MYYVNVQVLKCFTISYELHIFYSVARTLVPGSVIDAWLILKNNGSVIEMYNEINPWR